MSAVQGFNEAHIDTFSQPQPVPKTLRVLSEWMGTGQIAIDVGCGSGLYASLCRERGNAVFGIDITSQVRTAHARGLSVCWGNVERALPFPDKCFSIALCSEVVEHLLQPEQMLSELHRVLKPGGTLILTTPNYGHWVLRVLYLWGRPPVGLPVRHFKGLRQRVSVDSPPPWREPHIRFFTPDILRDFLRAMGFEVESLRSTFVGFPSALAPYLPWLAGLPLRVAGKLIGNLNFLGDRWPSLLAAGVLVKAVKST
jgi:SAM-dependent methyltransferase